MTATALVDYVTDRTGEYHRGSVRYDGDETDVLYLRSDVREERLAREIDQMLERLRPEASPAEELAFALGDLRATVRSFERATILHFPTGRDRGVVVSLEPETARDLNTFIGECSKRIHG